MARRTLVDPGFPAKLRALMADQRLSYRVLASRTFYSKSYLHDLASGAKAPTLDVVRRIDEATGGVGRLLAESDDESEAAELARRVAASDLSRQTLERLEAAVEDLATAYSTTAPAALLLRARHHLGYTSHLLDARATLAERRQLLVVAGWLSLLAATSHIDLRHTVAADARLDTAAELGRHAGHREIPAWSLETRAWAALVDGEYSRAVELSRQAQRVAPRGTSAQVQATAQEGRAWARQGERRQTRAALYQVEAMASSLPPADRPEHHYVYDAGKAETYTATTLAWAGDPAAVAIARRTLGDLEAHPDVHRPRRVALAHLDLALALTAAGEHDGAVSEASTAVVSGQLVPATWWRAIEVLHTVASVNVRIAAPLREMCETHRPR